MQKQVSTLFDLREYEQLSKLAERNGEAVAVLVRRAVAHQYGVGANQEKRTRAPFTPQEDAAIRRRFQAHGSTVLAKELGRSPSTIHTRAARLGVIESQD